MTASVSAGDLSARLGARRSASLRRLDLVGLVLTLATLLGAV
jgi:hypothetical protein